MINFKLRELGEIAPWGQAPELSLHWFGLTDGDLWLNFGDQTIYEYSKEAIDYWGKDTPYNSYQISRSFEDFTGIFESIAETIPKELYRATKDLKQLRSSAQKWLDIYADQSPHNDAYFDEYDKLLTWIDQRTFDSGHLIGGPYLSFFRHNDKIRIVWETEYHLENGISLWTAKDGHFEMDYSEFIQEVEIFAQSFLSAMGTQVELAIKKDWGQVKLDKQRLAAEHQERKNDFYSAFARLTSTDPTDASGISP